MVSAFWGPSASLPLESCSLGNSEDLDVAHNNVHSRDLSYVSTDRSILEQCWNNFSSSAALGLVVPPIVQVLHAAWSQ